jgi:predicted kinase
VTRVLDDNSAQPCGCDKGANWKCEWHRSQVDELSAGRRQHMLLLSGLPGSGKSTFARNFMEQRSLLTDARPVGYINYDSIANLNPGIKAKELKRVAVDMARTHIANGYDLVIDNTNLTASARETWKQLAHEHNLSYTNHPITTPVPECIERDRRREGKARVGRAVIETMALHAGMLDLCFEHNAYRDVIIVDMDGTLSDCSHRQHYVQNGNRDWDAFYAGCPNDPVNLAVFNLVNYLGFGGNYDVIIVSGRPTDKAGIATEEWLERFEIPFTHLFMRQRGDSRHDYIVKQEILDSMLKSGLDKSRIAFVLDDRTQVVNMWRQNGLPCFQVAPGDF